MPRKRKSGSTLARKSSAAKRMTTVRAASPSSERSSPLSVSAGEFSTNQDSSIPSAAVDLPFSQSIPSLTEQPLSSTQDVSISPRSHLSPSHTPPVDESFPAAINEDAQHGDEPVEMREVEPVQVREVPVPLPNYPAFCYNPQTQYHGARIGSMSATCRH